MPQKDASYHRAAIQYNEEIAVFTAELADKLEHEEVQRWCRSVSKQHKFHAGRHKKALDKMESKQETPPDPEPAAEATETGVETPLEQQLFPSEREELVFEAGAEEKHEASA